MEELRLAGRQEAPHAPRAHRRFVIALALVILAQLALVALVDLAMDPMGAFGTGLVRPLLVSAEHDTSKIPVLERLPNPDFVILGSSRVRRWNPATLAQGTRLNGFNMGLGGGSDVVEPLLVARWLAHRHRSGGPRLPHLVYGIDYEAFTTDKAYREVTFVPQLRNELPTAALLRARVENQLLPLLQLQTLRLSWREAKLYWDLKAPPPPQDHYDAHGMLPYSPPTPAERAQISHFFDVSFSQYTQYYREPGSTTPNPAALRQFEQLLRLANHYGDVPAIVVTPMHPDLAKRLDPIGRATRVRHLLDALHALQQRYRFTIVDDSHALDAHRDRSEWLDAVHTPLPTANLLMRALRAQDPWFARQVGR